jgi:hypothetical protein
MRKVVTSALFLFLAALPALAAPGVITTKEARHSTEGQVLEVRRPRYSHHGGLDRGLLAKAVLRLTMRREHA